MPPAPPARKNPTGETETLVPAPATFVVRLPADAVLTIDDQPTASTSSWRRIVTPDLKQGKEYFYTLKAELVADGHKTVASQRVPLRAGQESEVVLEFPKVFEAQGMR